MSTLSMVCAPSSEWSPLIKPEETSDVEIATETSVGLLGACDNEEWTSHVVGFVLMELDMENDVKMAKHQRQMASNGEMTGVSSIGGDIIDQRKWRHPTMWCTQQGMRGSQIDVTLI